jgi:dTDP-4-amino-4,6-dideoxygalactose transaminase
MIPYGRQSISAEDIAAVTRVLGSEFLTTGPEIGIFEKALEGWTDGTPAVAVSSGTAALHVAFKAIGIKPGDEVITPPLTFIATQATAALHGARIVFADVQEDTGNIDPSLIERLITKNTKAIVAVDYAGHPADLDELKNICTQHSLILVEDAAHSLGSEYKGKKVGSIADITTFSFFPTKNIATGEGGAVVSNNPKFLAAARLFARQGLIRDKEKQKYPNEGPWHQEVHDFSLNYRMPDILAALGTSQIARLEKFKLNRQLIFKKYSEGLAQIKNITLPTQKSYVDPVWHLFPIRVDASKRRAIFEELQEVGIKVQVNYIPAHWHPVFKNTPARGSLPISEKFYSTEISLPMSSDLSDSEISFVIENVKKIVG